jgi:hypothetical protein
LSVLDYKKQERTKEVEVLEEKRILLEEQNKNFVRINTSLHDQLCDVDHELRLKQEQRKKIKEEMIQVEQNAQKAQKKLSKLTSDMSHVEMYAAQYIRSPEEWLPEPKLIETPKAYRKRILPIIMNVIKLIQPLYARDLQLKNKCNSLESRNKNLEINNSRLYNELSESREENKMLHSQVNDLNRAKIILGAKVVNDAIQVAKQHEERVIQRRTISRRHSQDLGR